MRLGRQASKLSQLILGLVRPMPGEIACAFVAVILASCGSSDISHRSPFSSAIGRPLVTKRATFLYREPPPSPADWRKILNLQDDTLVRSPDYRRTHQEAFIPAGQQLIVHRVTQRVGDGIITYEAYGQIFVPSLRRLVDFRYRWGDYDKVCRAPWENSDVPTIRLLR